MCEITNDIFRVSVVDLIGEVHRSEITNSDVTLQIGVFKEGNEGGELKKY